LGDLPEIALQLDSFFSAFSATCVVNPCGKKLGSAYRILFEIDDNNLLVKISAMKHHKEAYRYKSTDPYLTKDPASGLPARRRKA